MKKDNILKKLFNKFFNIFKKKNTKLLNEANNNTHTFHEESNNLESNINSSNEEFNDIEYDNSNLIKVRFDDELRNMVKEYKKIEISNKLKLEKIKELDREIAELKKIC